MFFYAVYKFTSLQVYIAASPTGEQVTSIFVTDRFSTYLSYELTN